MRKFADKPFRLLLTAAVCGTLLVCAGCGSDDAVVSLYDGETLAYDHPQNGASLTLPADWEKLSETDEAVVFADADDTISLTLSRELGGYSYYSTDGLLDMAADVTAAVLQEPELLAAAELRHPDDAVLYSAAGRLAGAAEDSPNAICEAVVISPLSAVRYHLVVVSEVDQYAESASMLREIYASFHLNKTEDEIYEPLHTTAAE